MADPVDKSPQRIREMFDRISPRYDFLNHLLSLNTDVRWRKRAVGKLGKARRVLDVCCGTADLALEIRRGGAEVVGVDFAGRMLALARRKSRGRVALVQGDAMRLPFRDGSFDGATVAFGIRNVADTERGVAEMARVLRPGGRLVICEFTLPANRLVRAGYRLYFSRILPKVGKWISRSEAYRYLPDSVEAWWGPEELAAMLRRHGLADAGYELLTGGVAALHFGTRG
ncbi:MAG: bifunctional demethylmenaquinone methyltransferase/2-methoxy-6-polyprenyl-1,4-benzoquinol methylase UbiE [Planctomycetes bacterium]|nr:bifunctional demethylmenaquinone methyltransferase/2-methoxy-6-polyprenyl-1,4-benzoquinol methylase UbiE [Planctomycetota bacterium]